MFSQAEKNDENRSQDAGRSWQRMPPLVVDVPEGLLDLPLANDRRRILRFESGLVLDAQLRRLARLSGAVDRGLARGLWRLRNGGKFRALGYVSFHDYARERVADAARRTIQDFARLGKGLERLSRLDAALSLGRLNWTAALEVTRVAGPEDEAE